MSAYLRVMSDADHGTPYGENCTDPIDDWSRAIFEACRDWPLARSGRWFRVEDSWLRLRIEDVEGELLEPIFAIDVDAVDGQILVDCGSWGSPITPPGGSLREAAESALTQARRLIEGWLSGQLKFATYHDRTGWRGSKLIKGGELPAAIEPVPVELGTQARVIVKTWRRSDCQAWRYSDEGDWIACEIAEV